MQRRHPHENQIWRLLLAGGGQRCRRDAACKALGVISDADFITAMVLLLLALFFAQLGDHAAEREAQRRRYIDRRHARNAEPEYRQNRRDA